MQTLTANGRSKFRFMRAPAQFRGGLRRLGSVLSCVCACLLLAGCAASTGDSSSGTQTGRSVPPPRLKAGPAEGAPLAPREAQASTSLFRQMDLPPASEVRLGSGAPGPAYWQQRADYVIDATLDAATRRVSARSTVTYFNNSPHELDYVWFHLEQNLFAPGSRGSQSKPIGSRFGQQDGVAGGYTIERIALTSGQASSWHEVGTLGRLDLSQPIKPGEQLSIQIAWSFPVPAYGSDRMGTEDLEQGVVFQLAQWFPAVVKYDDVNGWNTLEYMGAGEFYTDFGRYEVSLTVPASHVVGAPGELVNASQVLTSEQLRRYEEAKRSDTTVFIRRPEEVVGPVNGTKTWKFVAEDVRTFAWATSEAFIWDAASVEVQRENGTARVLCQSLYPKEGQPLWEQSTQMTRHSIGHYSQMWYPYPWPSAINVNGIVGGMEYPGIVFCRARTDERALFGVTDHEFGHQWFPFIVNTDERRHAWMDEGFNSFINIYSNRVWWKDDQAFRGNRSPSGIGASMSQPNQQPIVTRPDFIFGRNLGYLAYGKPAVGLYLLREEILGQELFDRAFKEYINRWAFKSPQPADFFRTMEEVSGTDLGWFWLGWFYGTGTLDQGVAKVEQETAADGSPGWVRTTLTTSGGVVMPVEFEVTYADDTTERRTLPAEVWATTDAWMAGWDPQGRRVRSIVVDPDASFPDVNRANNRWGR
jgi:hypothetical protein